MEATQTIEPRIPNIAGTVPEALQALLALAKAAAKGGVPPTTHKLVHLRASQLNGCSFCVDMHSRELCEAGEPDEDLGRRRVARVTVLRRRRARRARPC